jgi:WD40 repeat protein
MIAIGQGAGVWIRGPLGRARRLESSARVLDLSASPDERYLLAAAADGTVAVWRIADGRRLATLGGHQQRVVHLAFSADGMVLAAGWDGRVLTRDLRALDAAPAALIDQLEARWGIGVAMAQAAGPR